MNNLEEALLETGLLDALIIPAEYREQVFSLDPECAISIYLMILSM